MTDVRRPSVAGGTMWLKLVKSCMYPTIIVKYMYMFSIIFQYLQSGVKAIRQKKEQCIRESIAGAKIV